jgi:hypothetical protein
VRKRVVFAVVCILAIPLLLSSVQGSGPKQPTGYGFVALAGRTGLGGWCQCGAEGCICDPGETPGGNIVARPSNGSPDGEEIEQGHDPGVDPASGMLILALAFLFWIRMR